MKEFASTSGKMADHALRESVSYRASDSGETFDTDGDEGRFTLRPAPSDVIRTGQKGSPVECSDLMKVMHLFGRTPPGAGFPQIQRGSTTIGHERETSILHPSIAPTR
jgi:hypothetical protein